MKKQSISSRKLKNSSDPKLAKTHEQGAVVELSQPSLDKVWGRYYFSHYRRSFVYLNQSVTDYEKTIELLKEARKTEVGKTTGVRYIDNELRDKLELASADFLIHSKLGLEYLCLEILPVIERIENHFDMNRTKISHDTILDMLKGSIKALNLTIKVPQIVADLLIRRDIVEHPNKDRLYNITNWKNVHVAWVLSGEIEKYRDELVGLVNEINQAFDKFRDEHEIPGTLQGVKRGVRADEPFKLSK